MTNQEKRSLVGQTVHHMVDKMPITYSVLELLTSNAVLDTYLASHEAVKLKIALKILTPALTAQPGFQARFQETIKALLQFNSPYLVKLYDYGNENETFYLVAEYHKSPTLRRKLDEDKRIALNTALEYIQILAEALAYAAQNNILHGSLSPLSITISSKRGPLLGDVGLAPLIGLRLPKALTDDLSLACYAAPEVVRGQSVSAFSDQYSLTAVLYEMVTGQPPYTASTPRQVIDQHTSAPIPNPAAIDPSLSVLTPLVVRGLAKDPSQRYPSYADFIGAVTEALRILSAPSIAPLAPPVRAPEPPMPAAAPMAMDRTMPEGISIEQLRRAAAPPPPIPPPARAPQPDPEPMAMDRTMPEGISIEQLRQAAAPPPPTLPPARTPQPEPMAMDRTMPEGLSIEQLRQAAAPPPPPARAPQPEPMAMDRTMPEGLSIDQLRQAAKEPETFIGEVPTPPPTAQPPPYQQPYVSPAARAPEPPLRAADPLPPYAAPYMPQSTQRNDTKPDSSPYSAPYIPQRPQPETPTPGYSRPATPGMEQTMQDLPMASYPGAQPSAPPESKPYDFSKYASVPPSVAGAQPTTARQLEEQYKTDFMRRSSIKRNVMDGGSGLTGMMAAPRPEDMKPKQQGRSPLLMVFVVLLLLIVAAAIGVFVLHTIGVI